MCVSALLRLTRPANLSRLPAITVPCGFTSGNLPAGLQLIGRSMDESTVLRAAYAYEQLTSWHEMFPPIRHSPVAAGPSEECRACGTGEKWPFEPRVVVQL